MAIAVALLQVTHHTGLLKMPEIKADVSKALLPLIAINVIGLGVNTMCLVYVDTSFYQVRMAQRSFQYYCHYYSEFTS